MAPQTPVTKDLVSCTSSRGAARPPRYLAGRNSPGRDDGRAGDRPAPALCLRAARGGRYKTDAASIAEVKMQVLVGGRGVCG